MAIPYLGEFPTWLGVVLLVLFICFWAYSAQKRVEGRQKKAIKESLDLGRRSLDLQEEGFALAEKSLRNQEEMIRLLRQLVGEHVSDQIAASKTT